MRLVPLAQIPAKGGAWDKQDSSNEGWAWYSYDSHNELLDSGGLDGRSSCSDKTLRARARAEAGVSGTRTPVCVAR